MKKCFVRIALVARLSSRCSPCRREIKCNPLDLAEEFVELIDR